MFNEVMFKFHTPHQQVAKIYFKASEVFKCSTKILLSCYLVTSYKFMGVQNAQYHQMIILKL